MLDASYQISVWAFGSGWTRRVAFAIASIVTQNARSWPDSKPPQSPFGWICYWVELAVPFAQTRVLQIGGKMHTFQKTALVPWELLALETVWLLPLSLSLLELKFHMNRPHVRGMLATARQVDNYSCWEEAPGLWVSGRGIATLWRGLYLHLLPTIKSSI